MAMIPTQHKKQTENKGTAREKLCPLAHITLSLSLSLCQSRKALPSLIVGDRVARLPDFMAACAFLPTSVCAATAARSISPVES